MSRYDNPIFIQLALEEIQIQKQLFVYSIELGEEAIIPPALDQRDLAQSYRFYNPVLSIVEELCQDHKKNLFIERNNQLLKQANTEIDLLQKIIKLFKSSKQIRDEAENE